MIDVELIGAPSFTVAVEGAAFRYAGINRALSILIGVEAADFVGRRPQDLLTPDYAAEVEAQYRVCVAERRSVDFEGFYDAPGGGRWWHTTVSPVLDAEDGRVATLIGVAVDITASKTAEQQVREAETRLSLAIDVLDGGFWHYDIAQARFATSPQLARFAAGTDVGPLDLRRFVALVVEEDRAATDLSALIRGEVEGSVAEYRVRTFAGETKWLSCRRRLTRDEAGRPSAIVGVAVDITDQKRLRDRYAQEASTDPLTGLPNRRGFTEAAARLTGRAGRGEGGFGLVLLDLDRFKPVNDLHGHAVGDEVLRDVATRLGRRLGLGDAAARLGGDEFAILVGDPGGGRIESLAGRLVEIMARPFTTSAGRVTIGVSVGATLWRPGDGDLAGLLARADAALLAVKGEGRGDWRLVA